MKKSYVNPYKFYTFINNSSDLFNYQMGNIMDSWYDSSMTNVIDGKFKAVCLSGIKTEDNDGSGTDKNDGKKSGDFIEIIVKPLTAFGNMLPDPRAYDDPDSINHIISMHATDFTARSDYSFDVTSPIVFGQVIDCYFEEGSIVNSDFKGLRFSPPKDNLYDETFTALATIEGVMTARAADWANSSLLGTDPKDHKTATEQGKCSNIQGTRTADKLKYIVIHYSAAFGSKKAVLSYENRATKYGYHYMIDRDGSFYNSASPESLIYHAPGNQTVKNTNSIGICLMNVGYERTETWVDKKGVSHTSTVKAKPNWISGKYPNGSRTVKWEPYSQTIVDSCIDICTQLCQKYNIPPENIVGHSDIQTNKSDPGPAFDMSLLRLNVTSRTATPLTNEQTEQLAALGY